MKIDNKEGCFDPVFDEIIQIPRYTPKHFKLLVNIFEKWKIMDFDLKYYIFEENNPQKTLIEVEKMLYQFCIKETCRNCSKTRKNLEIIISFIDNLIIEADKIKNEDEEVN